MDTENHQHGLDFSQRLSPEKRGEILHHVEGETRRVFEQMPFLPVHDITHVERVVANTRQICEGEGIDAFLPELAAWLHDIGRLQEIEAGEKGGKVYHAEASAEQIPEILEPFRVNLGADAIEAIQDAVAHHSMPNDQDDSQSTVILKDADKLDGLGAIGLPRVFAFYPERPIYNPTKPFGAGETNERYLRYSGQSTQIQAFFRNMEWFSHPNYWIVTNTAVKLAMPRIRLMMDVLYQLADELNIPRGEVDKVGVIQDVKERLATLDKA